MSSLVQKLEITRNFCQFADESEQFFVPLLNEAIAFAFSGNEITPPRIFFPTIQSLDLTRQLNILKTLRVTSVRKFNHHALETSKSITVVTIMMKCQLCWN